MYVETGNTNTPTRGRGHRVPKKNLLYEEETDEDKENYPEEVNFSLVK